MSDLEQKNVPVKAEISVLGRLSRPNLMCGQVFLSTSISLSPLSQHHFLPKEGGAERWELSRPTEIEVGGSQFKSSGLCEIDCVIVTYGCHFL